MKFKITLILFTSFLGFASSGYAQPANDNVCDAIELPVDGSIANYTNTDASTEDLEPIPDITIDCITGWCDPYVNFSVWFTFIAPASGEVTINLCLPGSYDTQLAVYEATDCSNFSTFTFIGANDNSPEYCENANYASFLNLTDLTPGTTYYVQVDPFTVNPAEATSFNIQISDGYVPFTPPTLIKIIHNSADTSLQTVDVRINGEIPDFFLDDLDFRSSTGFIQVESNTPVEITISESNSIDDSNPLKTFTISFGGGKHIVVLDGIYSSSGYSPDSAANPLSMYSYDNAVYNGTDYNVATLLFHQGVTDAPALDFNQTIPNETVLVDDISYSEFDDNYDNLLILDGDVTIQVTLADGVTEIGSYRAPIASNNWAGWGYTILSSGFIDPSLNSNGATFGLWAAGGSDGGYLFPLFTPGNVEYDDACNAATIATDGTPLSLSNAGLSVQTDEPLPPYGDCYGNLSWCDGEVTNSIWAKFTAPDSGRVTLSTCNSGINFNTQIAVYSVTDCNDFGTYTLVGANDDQYEYCEYFISASSLIVCGLNPGEEYYVQIDGNYGEGGNFSLTVTEGGACYSRIQFIHNSADMAAELVDVRVNGLFLNDQTSVGAGNDLAFRYSTPYLIAPSNQDLLITINPSDSQDDSNPIQSFVVNFDANKSIIAVIDGIASADGYDPDSASRPLSIYYYDQGEDFTGDYEITKLLFHHGATDVDSIDINEDGFGNIVDNLSYSNFEGYQTYSSLDDLNFQVTYGDGGDEINNYIAPLSSNYWGGYSRTILSSGFLNQANNSDGPAFGLYAAVNSFGGPLYSLPMPGNTEYDNACNAYLFPTDGTTSSLSNLGLTTQENEPQPLLNNNNYNVWGDFSPTGFNGWADNTLSQTIWGKFIAPASGEVTLSTCSSNVSFNAQIAVYSVIDCNDFSTYSQLGANDDAPVSEYYEGCYNGASTLPLCGLVPGQTYYVQVDNTYADELGGNFDLTINEGATCFARLQVINNGAENLLSNVDIRYRSETIDGEILNDYLFPFDNDILTDFVPGNDLKFRAFSTYIYVPSNTPLSITVNSANSTSDDDAFYTKSITLQTNTSNILIMEGILSGSGYTPGNLDAPFDLKLIEGTREISSDPNTVDIFFYHGSTDLPESNINELAPDELTLVDDLSFREESSYTTFTVQDGYKLNATLSALDDFELTKGELNLDAFSFLQGQAVTILLSGFSNPSLNSNGASLGFWMSANYTALASTGLIPLVKNNSACDAISIPSDGTLINANNIGATFESDEATPPFGSDCATQWCDYELKSTVWYKFVANSPAAEVSTCADLGPFSFFDSQIAVWEVEDCGDYSTYVLKGAADNNNCTYNEYSAVALACGLVSGETYYVQVDGTFFSSSNFKISVTPNEGGDCVVGLQENKDLTALSIFPNPTASGMLNINYELNVSGTSRIELLDVLGNKLQIVDLGKVPAGKITQSIDVSNLSNGLYFVNIIHNNKIISNKVQVQK
jgi:Secretion system C-terminal sorting domain